MFFRIYLWKFHLRHWWQMGLLSTYFLCFCTPCITLGNKSYKSTICIICFNIQIQRTWVPAWFQHLILRDAILQTWKDDKYWEDRKHESGYEHVYLYLSSLTESQCKDGVSSIFLPPLDKLRPHWQHWYLCDILNSNRSLEDKQKNLKLYAHQQRVLYFQQQLKCSLTHKLSSYKHLLIPMLTAIKFTTDR